MNFGAAPSAWSGLKLISVVDVIWPVHFVKIVCFGGCQLHLDLEQGAWTALTLEEQREIRRVERKIIFQDIGWMLLFLAALPVVLIILVCRRVFSGRWLAHD